MAEEFQESEVVFQENTDYQEAEEEDDCKFTLNSNSRDFPIGNVKGRRKKLKNNKKSVPMNIPASGPGINSWFGFRAPDSCFLNEEEGDDGEIVPPHVIIGRRLAGKMLAFSVCNGKRLQGRNLIQLRNSILRMTGFLET